MDNYPGSKGVCDIQGCNLFRLIHRNFGKKSLHSRSYTSSDVLSDPFQNHQDYYFEQVCEDSLKDRKEVLNNATGWYYCELSVSPARNTPISYYTTLEISDWRKLCRSYR
ncbi:hypothetical protein WUBG_01949 [Wuchereria bancrofti]|uniref:Uncharacterized protein n=1 Tax=Wuchereria bancrofti TaxID=6293 RepID=J9EY38_WUCBA|nr:hypothetical protein WUBG_01949 [Wuchereria bancrofti]VDM09726.1 unnamed protein product [Wuchereria bancrofti]